MEAIYKLNGDHGRVSMLKKVAEWFRWSEMYIVVGHWEKTYQHFEQRVLQMYDKPPKSWIGGCIWQCVGMDNSYISKTEVGYHQVVVKGEYFCSPAETSPVKPSTAAQIDTIIYKQIRCQLRIRESLVADGKVQNKNQTDLLIKPYLIRMSAILAYHAAANGVIEWGHILIVDAPSSLTANSNELVERLISNLPAVLHADRITIRHLTGLSPFCSVLCQDAALSIEMENLIFGTTNST